MRVFPPRCFLFGLLFLVFFFSRFLPAFLFLLGFICTMSWWVPQFNFFSYLWILFAFHFSFIFFMVSSGFSIVPVFTCEIYARVSRFGGLFLFVICVLSLFFPCPNFIVFLVWFSCFLVFLLYDYCMTSFLSLFFVFSATVSCFYILAVSCMFYVWVRFLRFWAIFYIDILWLKLLLCLLFFFCVVRSIKVSNVIKFSSKA